MENRQSFGNREISTNYSEMQKRLIGNQDMGSPKFTRKRPEVPNFLLKRIEKKSQINQQITYISPKKYLQTQNLGVDSLKSVTSFSSFTNNNKQKQCSTANLQSNIAYPIERDSFQMSQSIASLKQPEQMVFESAEEIIAKVRAKQQGILLKNKNETMEKKINELTQKIKSLKEENNFMYKKIEDFNDIIKQKNGIINHFAQMLRQKDYDMGNYQNQLSYLKKKNEQLESIIVLLNRPSQDSPHCSTCNKISDETDDGDKQHLEKQIQKYKSQIEELMEKVKYSQMQATMYQKLRYDLNNQMQKNETMKMQNKKLIARIQYLCSVVPSQTQNPTASSLSSSLPTNAISVRNQNIRQNGDKVERVSPIHTGISYHNGNNNTSFSNKSKRESQISFELSPQKSQK